MRILFIVALLTASASILSSCKSSKAANDNVTTTSEPDSGMSRLVVSFLSPGDGIDHEMRTKYFNWVREQPKEIAYSTVRWGREGEVDYCFTLSELSAAQQKEFVKKSREILAASEKVRVGENEKCREARR